MTEIKRYKSAIRIRISLSFVYVVGKFPYYKMKKVSVYSFLSFLLHQDLSIIIHAELVKIEFLKITKFII